MIIIKKYCNALFLIFLFSCVILHFKDSWHDIWFELSQTSLNEIGIMFIITSVYFIFDSMITYKMIMRYNANISFIDCMISIFYCVFLSTATMGSGGGIGEIHYFHNKGVDGAIAGSICIIKFVFKKIMILLIGLLTFMYLYITAKLLIIDYLYYLFLGTLLAFLILSFLFALLTSTYFSNTIFTILKKMISYENWLLKIHEFEQEIITFQSESKKTLKNFKDNNSILLLNLGKLTCLYLIPVIHFYDTLHFEQYITIFMVMAVCNMLAGVIPAPQGFGSLEFICFVLYGQIIPEPKILSMLVLFRFFTNVLPLLVGSLCFLKNRKKNKYILQQMNTH